GRLQLRRLAGDVADLVAILEELEGMPVTMSRNVLDVLRDGRCDGRDTGSDDRETEDGPEEGLAERFHHSATLLVVGEAPAPRGPAGRMLITAGLGPRSRSVIRRYHLCVKNGRSKNCGGKLCGCETRRKMPVRP